MLISGRFDDEDIQEVKACKRLMWAVLARSIQDTISPDLCQYYEKDHTKACANVWFTSAEKDHPFSFLAICDALGLNPVMIREFVFNPERKRIRNYSKRRMAA